VLAAVVIALFEPRMEETAAAYWIPLQRRLAYQGFVLLPIPGIGPFILPRFFGLPSPHDFPEACMGLTSGSTNPRLPVFLVTD